MVICEKQEKFRQNEKTTNAILEKIPVIDREKSSKENAKHQTSDKNAVPGIGTDI